ncbi:MAG: 50S ribosomal protein L22 [Chthoniobacterales bacterium]
MEVRSIYRYAKISPFKVREVTRAIQGLPVSAALDLVAFSPKKAAGLINKTLKSAVANAENNANLKVDGLVVKEATCGEGPTMKRMMTRARGSGSRILKRSSHIRIILTDEIEIKRRNKTKRGKKSGSAKGGAKGASRKTSATGAKAKSQPKRPPTEGGEAGQSTAPDPNLSSRSDVNE